MATSLGANRYNRQNWEEAVSFIIIIFVEFCLKFDMNLCMSHFIAFYLGLSYLVSNMPR